MIIHKKFIIIIGLIWVNQLQIHEKIWSVTHGNVRQILMKRF